MNYSCYLSDLPQKAIAQSFTLTGSPYQASDVHKLNCGRCDFLRAEKGGNLFQAGIRKRHYSNIWIHGAKRVILSRHCRSCQSIKDSGLSHIGKAYDAALEWHLYFTEYQRAVCAAKAKTVRYYTVEAVIVHRFKYDGITISFRVKIFNIY